MRVGAIVGAAATVVLLAACSSGSGVDRAAPVTSPSGSAPPAPSFTPEGPPRTRPGFKRVVIGTVGIGVPRGWSACLFRQPVPSGLEGPMISLAPPGPKAGLFSPMRFQVDPPPGGKLFDARNIGSRLVDAIYPDNEGRIGEIDVPNSIQTAALEFTAVVGGLDVTRFDAWAMGADGSRVGLSWYSERSYWRRIEPVFRDVAASIEFEVAASPTGFPECKGT